MDPIRSPGGEVMRWTLAVSGTVGCMLLGCASPAMLMSGSEPMYADLEEAPSVDDGLSKAKKTLERSRNAPSAPPMAGGVAEEAFASEPLAEPEAAAPADGEGALGLSLIHI